MIPLIKIPKALRSDYWSIAVTDAAVYFIECRSKNVIIPALIVSRPVADGIRSSRRKKVANSALDISELCQDATTVHRIGPEEGDRIKIQKKIGDLSINLHDANGKRIVRLRIVKQYREGLLANLAKFTDQSQT